MKPLCIDLFSGLGGWAEGFLSEGWDVIGFDIERYLYGELKYPAQLVLQDVRTLHGSQFRNAQCIVASPPCQTYSFMAMPFSRGKRIAQEYRSGVKNIDDLTELFRSCFRIQREACEAAGHHIPMVVENVKGAQPWVGKAKANFGSFYLWGDVDMVGDRIIAGGLRWESVRAAKRGRKGRGGDWFKDGQQGQDHCAAGIVAGLKNTGGSWFAIANNTTSGHKQNPDGRQIPEIDHNVMPFYVACESDGRRVPGLPGRSFQSAAVDGLKVPSMTGWDKYGQPGYKPMGFNVEAAKRFREERDAGGVKVSGDWFGSYAEQKAAGTISPGRLHGKKSDSRKAASAQIAKIPFALSSYIARSYRSSQWT